MYVYVCESVLVFVCVYAHMGFTQRVVCVCVCVCLFVCTLVSYHIDTCVCVCV